MAVNGSGPKTKHSGGLRAQSLVMVDPWPARFFGLWRSSLDNAYGGLTARSASGRAHGLLRLVRTDGTQTSRDSHRFGLIRG